MPPVFPSRPPILGALLAAVCAASVPAQEPPAPYDPLAGMDPDGRIPKPQVPGDVPHPERWRYTPPGRIKPGNVFERFLVSSFATPIVFREEDVGFGGGLALTDLDFREQRYREFANVLLTYSEEGQQAYRINWSRWLEYRELDNGGVLRDERNRLFGRLGYEKTLTRRFYGFGSRTRSEAETSYTEEVSGAGFGVRLSLPDPSSDWLLRTDLTAERHVLGRGHVTGVPDTGAEYPIEVAEGDGQDQLWLTTSLAHDSRDSLHQPYSGHRIGVSCNAAATTGGGTGAILGFDAQQVFPLPPLFHAGGDAHEENPPTDCFAIGGYVLDTVGELPFYSLPSLGGSQTLRSFIENRFTGRSAAHATAEYRIGLVPRGHAFTDAIRIERFGAALFYDLGTVADGIEDLDHARWHQSYGVGLRCAFSREAVFRIDLGFGDEGSNLSLGFGNTF